MLESRFQKKTIDEIKNRFPEAIVIKNDSSYMQGFPDLTILHDQKWATLECKKDRNSPRRPNQEYYVKKLKDMSFSAFIYPENKQEVLDELEFFFKG